MRSNKACDQYDLGSAMSWGAAHTSGMELRLQASENARLRVALLCTTSELCTTAATSYLAAVKTLFVSPVAVAAYAHRIR